MKKQLAYVLLFVATTAPLNVNALSKGDGSPEERRIDKFMGALCRDQKRGLPAKYFPKEGLRLDDQCKGSRVVRKLQPNELAAACDIFSNPEKRYNEPSWTAEPVEGEIYLLNLNQGNATMKIDLAKKKLLLQAFQYGDGKCE